MLDPITRVAVVGAGPAGLTAVKCLREAGLEAIAFEKKSHIGGLWHFDESQPDGGGIAYRSLKTNTSKKMTGYSDFPFPDEMPLFPHQSQVLEYLNSYADHFGLRPFICLNTTVNHINRNPEGTWTIHFQDETGSEQQQQFDALVIANGFYQKPLTPSLPGLDTFQGQTLHSAEYKGPEPFTGKRVIVIGSGSSGADIAGEVAETAEQVDISAKSGVWIVPRSADGKPLDTNMSPLKEFLPAPIKKILFQKIAFENYRKLGYSDQNIASILALPPFNPAKTRVTSGTTILKQLLKGQLQMKGGIQKFEPDGVLYQDGSRTKADTLIFCTGYAPNLPFFDPSIIQINQDHTFGLYRHVFHPLYDNLAFLAQCRVAGPVFPVMEMQARWAAAVFSGTAELPPSAQRQKAIEDHFATCRRQGKNPMRVFYADYMAEIAGQFGVQPKLLNHPGLIPKLLFGPVFPARYRLDGPGKKAIAKEIIEHFNAQ